MYEHQSLTPNSVHAVLFTRGPDYSRSAAESLDYMEMWY